MEIAGLPNARPRNRGAPEQTPGTVPVFHVAHGGPTLQAGTEATKTERRVPWPLAAMPSPTTSGTVNVGYTASMSKG
jgi:hypothetical protein